MIETLDINDPAQVEEIKAAIRDTEFVFGVTSVTVGEHPKYGKVVLIETDGGSLLVRAQTPELPPMIGEGSA